MSGAGLPCATSSPATVAANAPVRPERASVWSSRSRGDDEATPITTPRSCSSQTVSSASGNGSSSSSISANSVAEWRSQNGAAGSSAGIRSAKNPCTSTYGRPTSPPYSSSSIA